MTAAKPDCRGCFRKSDRIGLCKFCRSAAAELRPPKDFDPDDSLKSLREMMEEWVRGLPPEGYDRFIAQARILFRHLDDGGEPPGDWKPPAGATRPGAPS